MGVPMLKNITLSAEDVLIKKAREKAAQEKKSLNTLFREWLSRYTGNDHAGKNYDDLMKAMKHINAGKKFSRDELNER